MMMHTLLSFLTPAPVPAPSRARCDAQARYVRPVTRAGHARLKGMLRQSLAVLADTAGFAALMLGCWIGVAALAALVT